jgi:hypothetical protein
MRRSLDRPRRLCDDFRRSSVPAMEAISWLTNII